MGLAIVGVEHSMSLSRVLQRLQDTTAQIRVRAAFVLLIGFTALAASSPAEAAFHLIRWQGNGFCKPPT